MPRRVTVRRVTVRYESASVMKKRSSVTLKSIPPKKASTVRSPLRRRSTGSAPTSEEFSTRLEVITILPARTEPPLATPVELQRVRFGYFQPGAREIFLVGSFNDWNPHATPLKRDALGDWSVELPLPPGEYRYRLRVDDEWRDDPSAQQTAMNSYGGFDAVIVV